MNEYLLNLAGFTSEEWEDLKGRVANKLLFWWQSICELVTPERMKTCLAVLIIFLILLGGFRLLISVWPVSPSVSHVGEPEATESASPTKRQLEVRLESLQKEVEHVFDENPDLLYPFLETGIEL